MKLTLSNLLSWQPKSASAEYEWLIERKRELAKINRQHRDAPTDTRTITGLRLGGGSTWRERSQQRMDKITAGAVQLVVDRMNQYLDNPTDPLAGFGDVPVDNGAHQKLTIPDERGTRFVAATARATDAATVGDVGPSPEVAEIVRLFEKADELVNERLGRYPPVPDAPLGRFQYHAEPIRSDADYKTTPAGGGFSGMGWET